MHLSFNPDFTFTLGQNPSQHPPFFLVHILSLPFSRETYHMLSSLIFKRFSANHRFNPVTIGHLVNLTEEDLLNTKGFGPKMVSEIKAALAANGLQLRTHP